MTTRVRTTKFFDVCFNQITAGEQPVKDDPWVINVKYDSLAAIQLGRAIQNVEAEVYTAEPQEVGVVLRRGNEEVRVLGSIRISAEGSRQARLDVRSVVMKGGEVAVNRWGEIVTNAHISQKNHIKAYRRRGLNPDDAITKHGFMAMSAKGYRFHFVGASDIDEVKEAVKHGYLKEKAYRKTQ
jgi:hypothetical protein